MTSPLYPMKASLSLNHESLAHTLLLGVTDLGIMIYGISVPSRESIISISIILGLAHMAYRFPHGKALFRLETLLSST